MSPTFRSPRNPHYRLRAAGVLIMVIVGMVGTFGLNFQITTALMARSVFHEGVGEYGLLGEESGPRWTILVGSIASLATAVGAVAWLLLRARARADTPARGGPVDDACRRPLLSS